MKCFYRRKRKYFPEKRSYLMPSGETPLNVAISNNYAETTEFLIEQSYGINFPDSHGTYPLHSAVKSNNPKATSALLRQGALPDVQDNRSFCPLQIACMRDMPDIVKTLLDHGAQTESSSSPEFNKPSPIRLALESKAVQCVKHLLNHNTSTDRVDDFGSTILIRSVSSNTNNDISRLLIGKSKDIGQLDKFGNSALAWAIHGNNCSIAEMILEKEECEDNYTPKEVCSPLIIAIQAGCWKCFYNVLEKRGANSADDLLPSPLLFSLLYSYFHFTMSPSVNSKHLEEYYNGWMSNDRIEFAKYLLYNNDVDTDHLWGELYYIDSRRDMGKDASEIFTLCIQAVGTFGKSSGQVLLDQENLFLKFWKFSAPFDLIHMLHFAGLNVTDEMSAEMHDGNRSRNEENKSYLKQIDQWRKNPRSLLNIALIQLRLCISNNVIYKARSLPIQKSLFELITFRFHINEHPKCSLNSSESLKPDEGRPSGTENLEQSLPRIPDCQCCQ